jgi:hypothetical protein
MKQVQALIATVSEIVSGPELDALLVTEGHTLSSGVAHGYVSIDDSTPCIIKI